MPGVEGLPEVHDFECKYSALGVCCLELTRLSQANNTMLS
jgi:hypothetical protein